MHQSYTAIFVAESFLVTCIQHPRSLQDGLSASASGRRLKLQDLIHQKTSLQLLLFVEESTWSACRGGGAVS